MTTSLIFLGAMMITIVVWLIRQTINTTPWVAEATAESAQETEQVIESTGRFGLIAFIGVVISFFALFVSAYAMRMTLDDWTPLTEPRLLWANTMALVLASVALQMAWNAARRGELDRVRNGMIAGTALSLLFLLGQFLAWRELVAGGYYLQSNASYAFFYLFTGLHGLHLAGGLYVLARATRAVIKGGHDPAWLRKVVELCTIYWHFLLVVWLGLYWLLLVT